MVNLPADITNAFEKAGFTCATKRTENVERYTGDGVAVTFDHDLQTVFFYDKEENTTIELQPEEIKALYLYCVSQGWTDGVKPVVHARFEPYPENIFRSGQSMRCSNCGGLFPYEFGTWFSWEFCPCCGAKMDGEKGG